MNPHLYRLHPQSSLVYLLLIAMSLLICHFGITPWEWAYWELFRKLVVLVGLIANVYIIYYHITTPPHPKFLLSPQRKRLVRIHAVLGISEVLLGTGALFWPASGLGLAFALLALMHAFTSYLQTPSVFGIKALMVPLYFFGATIHLYCGAQLLMAPQSSFWIMNTFLALNIYAYVRIFLLLFEKLGLFKQHHYSASVLCSGLPIVPALIGPVGIPIIAAYLGTFALLYRLVFNAGKTEMKELWAERVRVGLVNEQQKRAWRAQNPGARSQNNLGVDRALAQKVFRQLDVRNRGTLEAHEMARALGKWGLSPTAVASIVEPAPDELSAQHFCQRLQRAPLTANELRLLKKGSCATDEERARVIFQELDFDNSGYIDAVAVEMLLQEYGLPKAEAHAYLASYSHHPGRGISFHDFKANLAPLWKFAYYSVD